MNNVQFITWKPLYWIQHLALSPIPSIFQHSWSRKEIKAELNSQSHYGLYSAKEIHAVNTDFVTKSCHYNANLYIFAAESKLFTHLAFEAVCSSASWRLYQCCLYCHAMKISKGTPQLLANLRSTQWWNKKWSWKQNNLDNNYSKYHWLSLKTHNNSAGT